MDPCSMQSTLAPVKPVKLPGPRAFSQRGRMNSTTVAAATVPALTTPFAVPASCTDVFNTTITYRTGVYGDATHYTVHAAFPQTTGGCQASGPNVLRDGATIIVRPGVCPSDWVAYNLKFDDPHGFSATGTVNDIPSFGPACTKLVSETQGVTSGQTTTTLTVSAHAAWHIEWMASDAPTLTPQPPSMELCYDVQIPTWTPGAEATGRKKCKSLKVSPDKHHLSAKEALPSEELDYQMNFNCTP
ncbi:hypothetical protein ARSEF1564_005520 [Beauveria bassiana]